MTPPINAVIRIKINKINKISLGKYIPKTKMIGYKMKLNTNITVSIKQIT